VVATHDPAVIDRFDRGIMLENGEVVFDGPPQKLPDLLGDNA
jgi:ABC-type bacteriocin/lantibiotic exporter with double-glycine peptidase domain